MVDFAAGLRPPLRLALAKAVEGLPRADAVQGGVAYEPKWDGFRMCCVRGSSTSLWSRQGKDLSRAFPEILDAASAQIPEGMIVDGEVVLWREGRLEFDDLLRRVNVRAETARRMARAAPASFVAFDVLAHGYEDTRAWSLRERRALLEEAAAGWAPPLNVSPSTTDEAEAAGWFESMVDAGIEGLVVKALEGRYEGGERAWWKVKHRESLDVVCAAVTGSRARPREVVVGVWVDGRLRIAGRSTPLSAKASRLLGAVLQEPIGEHPWPEEVKPGALSRFNRSGSERVPLVLVEPMVVEISADVAMMGQSFRHPVRFLRPRPELDVDAVTWPLR
ncbi:ATP-dependent DNA ligase [Microbacterium aurantiacum]|uniref:ATP-dependent DNA ligase n=1 Tax=Microbacterium aurantiacum TaxID=162393 RepID=UPI000C7FC44D|nr:ATP-dependent DNA ligase [Microbacterium aurantiacum]